MKVRVEFLGGLDVIFGGVRQHKVELDGSELKMKDLVSYISKHMIKDPHDVVVFLYEGTVRPGILVLVNDTDWELEGEEEYELEDGDLLTFTSTLHGG